MIPPEPELDDKALRNGIEDGSLPPDRFGHREHVRLAWIYLTEHDDDLALAAASFRSALRRYATAVHAHGKYHETLTWAWLAIIHEAMQRSKGSSDSAATELTTSMDLLAAHPELLEQTTLDHVYDVRAMMRDPFARHVFVLPRRRPTESPSS